MKSSPASLAARIAPLVPVSIGNGAASGTPSGARAPMIPADDAANAYAFGTKTAEMAAP